MTGLNITATVEIKGLPQNCPQTFSGTAAVGYPPVALVTSEDDDWLAPEMKDRIAAFYDSLKKYPKWRAVIVNYGTGKETARREAEFKKLIKQEKHDIKLIEFVRDNRESGIRTKFFLVPPGAETPVPIP